MKAKFLGIKLSLCHTFSYFQLITFSFYNSKFGVFVFQYIIRFQLSCTDTTGTDFTSPFDNLGELRGI